MDICLAFVPVTLILVAIFLVLVVPLMIVLVLVVLAYVVIVLILMVLVFIAIVLIVATFIVLILIAFLAVLVAVTVLVPGTIPISAFFIFVTLTTSLVTVEEFSTLPILDAFSLVIALTIFSTLMASVSVVIRLFSFLVVGFITLACAGAL